MIKRKDTAVPPYIAEIIQLDCFPMSIFLVYAAKREEKHGRDGS